MRIRWRLLLALAIASFLALPRTSAAESPAQTKAKAALADLTAWLGANDNARRWREFARVPQLEAELAKDEPSLALLAEAESQLASREPGLEKRRFVALQQSLGALRLERLAAAARSLAGTTIEPTPEQQAAHHTALRDAASKASKLISGWTSAQQDLAQQHLRLDLLAAAAAGKDVSPADQDKLLTGLRKYRWTDDDGKDIPKLEGLEAPEFSAVRKSLRKLLVLAKPADERKRLLARAADDLQQIAAAALSDEAPKLADSSPLPLPRELHAGNLIELLADAGVDSPLLAATQQNFGQHNLHVRTSQRFLSKGIEEDQNRTEPVRDCILGTDIHGTAHLIARSKIVLLDSPRDAKYDIFLLGNVHSNTVGYNGPVTIYSTGVTSVWAKKQLTFTDVGLTGDCPTVHCCTKTSINDICAKHRIVENIAWKRATAAQPEAEAIASERAEERIGPQFDEQATSSIGKVNQRYRDGFREPLEIRDESPREFATSSRDRLDFLTRITQASLGQLSAALAAPAAQPGDVVVQVHETYVANMGRAMLGGERFTQNQQGELRKRLNVGEEAEEKPSNKPPEGLAAANVELFEMFSDEDKLAFNKFLADTGYLPDVTIWPDLAPKERDELARLLGHNTAIEFDRTLPVRAEFGAGHVVLAIRLARVTRTTFQFKGEKVEIDVEPVDLQNLELAARYSLDPQAPDRLLRDGEVMLNLLDPSGELARKAKDKREEIASGRVRSRFAKELFKPTLDVPMLTFKPKPGQEAAEGNWENIKPMPVKQTQAARGWFTLGWELAKDDQ